MSERLHTGRTARGAKTTGAVLASALICLPSFALPQQADGADGALVFTFGITERVRINDNRELTVESEGTTILSETELTFGMERITENQTFLFTIGDTYRFGSGPSAPDSPAFLLPDLTFDYAQETRDIAFDVSADLITEDLLDTRTTISTTDPTDIITDDGFLTRRDLSIGFEAGLNAPFGASVRFSEFDRSYDGSNDPDLFDNNTVQGEAALIFRPSPISEARLSYLNRSYEAEDTQQTSRRTETLRFSAARDLDPVTVIDGSVGWTRIEETQRATGVDLPDDQGLIGSIGILRELSSGTAGANLSHDVDTAGGRTDFVVSRSFALPAGAFSFDLGVTEPNGGTFEPTARVGYLHERTNQTFFVDAATEIVDADDGSLQRATRFGLDYDYQLSELSSLALTVDYARNDDAGGDVPVTERETASASLSFRYRVAENWLFQAGYTHRRSQEDTIGTAHSNEVFFSLGRDFSWRR